MDGMANGSGAVVPSVSCLFFWTDVTYAGSLGDLEQKFRFMFNAGLTKNGFECYLDPLMLGNDDIPSELLVREFLATPAKTLHIGNPDHDFLVRAGVGEKLRNLKRIMDILDLDTIVVHVSSFRLERGRIRALLNETMPDVKLWLENDGFQDAWGYWPENCEAVLRDIPEARFVFDFAHVFEVEPRCAVDDFLKRDIFMERMEEVHCSWSNVTSPVDRYEAAGYPGYKPYHALFSIVGLTPGDAMMETLRPCRKVVEGVVPREDAMMDCLRRELEMLKGR